MKKYLSIILTLIMVLVMTSAFAFDWNEVAQTNTCDQYNVILYKLEKLEGLNGDVYRIAQNKTAKVGETVYFSGYALGETSIKAIANAFTAEDYKLTDLAQIAQVATTEFMEDAVGGINAPIFSAKVTGANPAVKVVLKSGSDVTECSYKGTAIVTAEDSDRVVLGEYTFIRNATNGMVSDVYFGETKINKNAMTVAVYEKAIAGLNALGITVDDIENYRICMNNANIIKNFGNYCETAKSLCWGEECVVNIATLSIPKTGEAPLWIQLLEFFGIKF